MVARATRAVAVAQPDMANCAVHEPPFGFRQSGTADPGAIRVSTARASGEVRIPPVRGRAGELRVIGALVSAVAGGARGCVGH